MECKQFKCSLLGLEEADSFAFKLWSDDKISDEARDAIIEIRRKINMDTKLIAEKDFGIDCFNYSIMFKGNDEYGYEVTIKKDQVNYDKKENCYETYNEVYSSPCVKNNINGIGDVVIQKGITNNNKQFLSKPGFPYIQITKDGSIIRNEPFGCFFKRKNEEDIYLIENGKHNKIDEGKLKEYMKILLCSIFEENLINCNDNIIERLLKELNYKDIFDKQIKFKNNKLYIIDMLSPNDIFYESNKGICYSLSPFYKYEGELFGDYHFYNKCLITSDDYQFKGKFYFNDYEEGEIIINKTKNKYILYKDKTVNILIIDTKEKLKEVKIVANFLHSIGIINNVQLKIISELDFTNIRDSSINFMDDKIYIKNNNKEIIIYEDGRRIELFYKNNLCVQETQYNINNEIISYFKRVDEGDIFKGYAFDDDFNIKYEGSFSGSLPNLNHTLLPIGQLTTNINNLENRIIIKGNDFEICSDINGEQYSYCKDAIVNYNNGDVYNGNVLKAHIHGNGTFIFNNGDRYVGGFYYNQISSNGVYMSNETKEKYNINHNGKIYDWEIEIGPIIINNNDDKIKKIIDLSNIFNFLSSRTRNGEKIFSDIQKKMDNLKIGKLLLKATPNGVEILNLNNLTKLANIICNNKQYSKKLNLNEEDVKNSLSLLMAIMFPDNNILEENKNVLITKDNGIYIGININNNNFTGVHIESNGEVYYKQNGIVIGSWKWIGLGVDRFLNLLKGMSELKYDNNNNTILDLITKPELKSNIDNILANFINDKNNKHKLGYMTRKIQQNIENRQRKRNIIDYNNNQNINNSGAIIDLIDVILALNLDINKSNKLDKGYAKGLLLKLGNIEETKKDNKIVSSCGCCVG